MVLGFIQLTVDTPPNSPTLQKASFSVDRIQKVYPFNLSRLQFSEFQSPR